MTPTTAMTGCAACRTFVHIEELVLHTVHSLPPSLPLSVAAFPNLKNFPLARRMPQKPQLFPSVRVRLDYMTAAPTAADSRVPRPQSPPARSDIALYISRGGGDRCQLIALRLSIQLWEAARTHANSTKVVCSLALTHHSLSGRRSRSRRRR